MSAKPGPGRYRRPPRTPRARVAWRRSSGHACHRDGRRTGRRARCGGPDIVPGRPVMAPFESPHPVLGGRTDLLALIPHPQAADLRTGTTREGPPDSQPGPGAGRTVQGGRRPARSAAGGQRVAPPQAPLTGRHGPHTPRAGGPGPHCPQQPSGERRAAVGEVANPHHRNNSAATAYRITRGTKGRGGGETRHTMWWLSCRGKARPGSRKSAGCRGSSLVGQPLHAR